MSDKSQVIAFDIPKKTGTPMSVEDFLNSDLDNNLIYWIHCDIGDDHCYLDLTKKLNLDDTFNAYINDSSPIPRADDTESSLTLKIQVPNDLDPLKGKDDEFSTLIIHLTKKYCLTLSHHDLPAIQAFRQYYERSLRYAQTPCFILFLIMDNVLNDYAEIVFLLETVTDDLDYTVRSSQKNYYRKVMKVKKQTLHTKRYASAIRDILMRVSGRKMSVVSDACRKSMADLYNHSQVIVSEADSVREILHGLLDQIDNALIFRMSETMKVLTAFAAIFLPLTLITGIYGMNFKFMPELEWEYGYYFAIGLIFVTGFGLYYYFKRKKWF